MKKNLSLVLAAACIVSACFFGVLTVQDVLPDFTGQIEQEELRDTFVSEKESEYTDSEILGVRVDFAGLKEVNEDIVGWIYIPGTKVNYPVLQHQEDDSYYLYHSFRKQESKLGSIYIYHSFAEDFSDAHTVLFGHNMASGQMFGELSNYETKGFRDQYPYVYLCLPGRTLQCVVYSACSCSVQDAVYREGYKLGTKEYSEFIVHTKEKSLWECGITPGNYENVYTLSTCVDSGDASRRFIVNCTVVRTEISKDQEV